MSIVGTAGTRTPCWPQISEKAPAAIADFTGGQHARLYSRCVVATLIERLAGLHGAMLHTSAGVEVDAYND